MIRPPVNPVASVKWLAILIPMAAAVGSASAFFLWSLDWVTRFRFSHPWLLWLLPVGGFLVGWVYRKFGGGSGAGNNLLIDEIHQPRPHPCRIQPPIHQHHFRLSSRVR